MALPKDKWDPQLILTKKCHLITMQLTHVPICVSKVKLLFQVLSIIKNICK